MNEQEAVSKMVAPGQRRQGKPYGGVIQIHVTRACNLSCYSCTQGSNLGGKTEFMSPVLFEQAVLSLKQYWGVVGLFGGNPAVSPYFKDYCHILRKHIPLERRGLWCNDPISLENAVEMSHTFNPAVSNLNVHLDQRAYNLFKQGWPESRPFGVNQDSRHSPCYVALKDVLVKKGMRPYNGPEWPCEVGDCNNQAAFIWRGPSRDALYCKEHAYDEQLGWELISKCPINQHWSAMVCQFRGQLRGFFCEIAGAQAMLHQHESDYPDTGIPILSNGLGIHFETWWRLPMKNFSHQARKHCHDCGVPMQGHGELAISSSPEAKEQVSATHESIYKPKRKGRTVELVMVREQLGTPLEKMTDYLGNAKK